MLPALIIVTIVAIISLLALAHTKNDLAYEEAEHRETRLRLVASNKELEKVTTEIIDAREIAKKQFQDKLTKLTDQRDMYKHRLEQLTGVHNV